MTIDQILSRILIDSAFSESETLELENTVRLIFESSPTARDILNRLIVEDETLSIDFVPGQLSSSFDGFEIRFDFAALDNLGIINQNGDVVADTLERVLTHEIVHAITGLVDIDFGNENSPDFDYTGDTVRLTNQIFTELGDPDQRVSYTGLGVIGGDLLQESYTFGNEIDNAISAFEIDSLLLDTSVNTTPTRDLLIGDNRDNLLQAGAGEDYLYGENGNDSLSGGADNDFLSGGDGLDFLSGGTGDDTLEGDGGDDILAGGSGFDVLSGGDGSDVLEGGAGDDTLYGDSGIDFLSGNAGGDDLNGGDGDDFLRGNQGDDNLDGGGGDDVLIGGGGFDFLTGGEGADVFVFDQFGDDEDTVLDFEKGQDLLNLSAFGFTFADFDDNSDGVLNLEDEGIDSADDGRSTAIVDEDGFSFIILSNFTESLIAEDFIF